MKSNVTSSRLVLSAVVACLSAVSVNAQTPGSHLMNDATVATDVPAQGTAGLQKEVTQLREQVQALEQRLQATAPSASPQSGAMKMNMHGTRDKKMSGDPQSGMGKAKMAMMDDDMPMSDPAPTAGSRMPAPSGGGMEMMGMGAMGGMKSPAAMATPSALPGFPGQSHLYHIGAGGFFLEHAEHINLTTAQQQTLARLKEQALLRQGEQQRQIDAAEEKLWQLTGSDQPQIASIDKQVKEIERLKAEKRIAFIRAVGEAAKALTDEQRMQLTGLASAAPRDSASMSDNSQSKSGHM